MTGMVRRLLKNSDKSLNQIMRESGVDKAALSRIISGQRGCTIETAERLLHYFGYQVEIRKRKKAKL